MHLAHLTDPVVPAVQSKELSIMTLGDDVHTRDYPCYVRRHYVSEQSHARPCSHWKIYDMS